jgi:hypothetical protein
MAPAGSERQMPTGDEPLVPLLDDLARERREAGGGGAGAREYWKVKAPEKREASTTRSVSAKSASVSVGKPTMMSVVIAASGIWSRTRDRIARNRSLR